MNSDKRTLAAHRDDNTERRDSSYTGEPVLQHAEIPLMLTWQQTRPFSILDLPSELRLVVYEYCAGIQTKIHNIVAEPRNLSFQNVLMTTSIQIHST
jgi:hypothetical protein